MTEEREKRVVKTVLPQHLAGGPHGLGKYLIKLMLCEE